MRNKLNFSPFFFLFQLEYKSHYKVEADLRQQVCHILRFLVNLNCVEKIVYDHHQNKRNNFMDYLVNIVIICRNLQPRI